MIDSTDKLRMSVVKEELEQLLKHPRKCIFAFFHAIVNSKRDLPYKASCFPSIKCDSDGVSLKTDFL